MEWLNYHHLFYFWTVASEGTITGASKKLHLAQPTISAQLRTLEEALGEKINPGQRYEWQVIGVIEGDEKNGMRGDPKEMDKNGDGKIDRKELTELPLALSTSR